jgi:hypothetical protein
MHDNPPKKINDFRFLLLKKMNSWISRNRLILYLTISVLLTFLSFLWTYKNIRIVYAINDDVQMQEIANGSFSGRPDGHLFYIKYILGWAISQLYLLNRHFDWYGLIMLGFLHLCLLLILFRAQEKANAAWRSMAVVAMVFTGYVLFGLPQVTSFQFTTVAGFLAATAIFWLYSSDPRTGIYHYIDPLICAFLMLFCFVVRSDIFYMSLPLFGVVFFYKNFEWQNNRINQKSIPLLILIGVSGSYMVERSAYKDPAWKDYLEFNKVRSQLYDFCRFPDFSENRNFYRSIDVSQEEFDLLQEYVFIPNPSANSQTFYAILEKCNGIKNISDNSKSLVTQTSRMMYTFFDKLLKSKYAAINITCGVLIILVIIKRKAYFRVLPNLLVISILTIPFAESMYLIYIGRFIGRVIWVIYLIEILLLFAIMLKDKDAIRPTKNRFYLLAIGMLSIFILIEMFFQIKVVKNEINWLIIQNNECQSVKTYIVDHPENYYFLDTWSFSSCTRNFRIRANDHIDNSSNLGGWEFFSPLQEENFLKYGIINAQQDLIERNNVLLIFRHPHSINSMVDFYRSMEINVTPVIVDTLDFGKYSEEVVVYKLESAQDLIP